MSENLSSNKSINTESISAIEKTLKALHLDLNTKKQQIEIIRNLIHNDKTTYNSEIKKFSELNQQIIRTEQEIETIDKQISSLIKKQKLFYNNLNNSFYSNFKDTYNSINPQITIAFFQFCGFEDANINKCNTLKQLIKNENELLFMLIQAEKYQKDLYETRFNKFKVIKTHIVTSNKETLPYVYEQLFIHISCVYEKIELNSQKEGLIQVNELNYDEKNKIFILLKQLEYAIVKNSRIYRQLYSYIKGAKAMLIQYNSIKTTRGSKDITPTSGNNSVSNSNTYGVYMNFIKCVREFRKTHWQTNLYLNKIISQTNANSNLRGNHRNDEEDILNDIGEGLHYTDQNMSILSEFTDDKSEISSINRDLIDTSKNMDIIYKSISITKKHIGGLYNRNSPQMKKPKKRPSKMNNSQNVICKKPTLKKITKETISKKLSKTISKVTSETSLHNTNHILKSLILNNPSISVNTPQVRTPTKNQSPNIKLISNTNISKNRYNSLGSNNFGTLINLCGSKTLQKNICRPHTPVNFIKSKTCILPKDEIHTKKKEQIKSVSPSNSSFTHNKKEKPKSIFISRNEKRNTYLDGRSSNTNQTFQSTIKADANSINNGSTQANVVTSSFDKIISKNNENTNNEDINEQLELDCVCDEMLNLHTNTTPNQIQFQITKMSFPKQKNKFINNFEQFKRNNNGISTSSIKVDPKKCGCCISCT